MHTRLGISPRLLALVLGILLFITTIHAMKFEDFKKCDQSGFCRRNRAYADHVTEKQLTSPYVLLKESILLGNNNIYADIKNKDTDILLTLNVQVLQDNTARVRINEKTPIKPRYEEHGKYTIVNEPVLVDAAKTEEKDGIITITLDEQRKIAISPEPVRIEFLVKDEPIITFNDRGFFNFEHLRTKETHTPKMIEKKNEDGTTEMVEADSEKDLWEETFKSWTDPKPNGPESLALDITFNGFPNVYGIPEHASSLSLKETRGGDNAYTDPYRLYNTDVFEYALDSPTALYGAVPLMVAHKKGASAGIFWMNPSETWIDIVKTKADTNQGAVQKVFNFNSKKETSTQTHWISEAGVLDVFVFFGPTTKDILRQYTALTGTLAMPQMFSLGYHQCRWNYINTRDVLEVDSKFDEFDMPYDVIWLDIEYTDDKKYFTWDKPKFSDPIKMEEVLDSKGRKLVAIVDPHIKRAENYYICDEAKSKDLFIKKTDKADYEAWCWPGQSSWVDFVKEEAYNWWKEQFKFSKFDGTRENVYIWNDMNEPSVFNGPEITIQKEMIHDGKYENRVLHNLYAMLSQAATSDGVRERTAIQKRPFVLARGFYAGAQRHGAVWTGDNMADWQSLYYTSPMNLANGLGAIAFTVQEGAVTADVYFPGNEPWYHFKTHKRIQTNGLQTVDAPLDTTPAYYRGGYIIPRRERVRRSTTSMKLDPFTLVIAKNNHGDAKGSLYLDDEETYRYQKGAYAHTEFNFANNELSCKSLHETPGSDAASKFINSSKQLHVERLVILGSKSAKRVQIVDQNGASKDAEFSFDNNADVLTVKSPKVSVVECGWKVIVS
ncbi:glycoside hydrolase family 31 protein [Backusella circina FSU 941]|nr:glycoside hydrolase family 31 protein [Backusella circina FSU 941]